MAEDLYKIEIEVSKSDLETLDKFAIKFGLSRNRLLVDIYRKAIKRFSLMDDYQAGRTEDIPIDDKFPVHLIESTIGTGITVTSNDYDETTISSGEVLSSHEIEFCIDEEDPDIFAFGILFVLSMMSFIHAAPRGYSEKEFVPDEDWKLGYFLSGLDFEHGHLRYYGDYVSGRMMKTRIIYNAGGKVSLHTSNRGKSADRWLLHLQGKSHIKEVKK